MHRIIFISLLVSISILGDDWERESVDGTGNVLPAIARGGVHDLDLLFLWWDKEGDQKHDYFHSWRDTRRAKPGKPVPAGFSGNTSPGSLIANGIHSLNFFYRGPDARLWMIAHDGTSWGSPESLMGDKIKKAPVAITKGLHVVDLFYVGTNDHVWTRHWNGRAWSSGQDIGGDLGRTNISAPLAAVSKGPNTVDVFYVNKGRLFTIYHDGRKWHPAKALEETVNSNLSGTSDIFTISTRREDSGGVEARARAWDRSYLFFRSGEDLIALTSWGRGPWQRMVVAQRVSGQIAAASPDEVYFIGDQASTGSRAGGLYRLIRK